MNWDVKSVRPQTDFVLEIVLCDGREGVFDMKPYLDFGAFKQLLEPGYFQQVDVKFGAVAWPRGQDIAPDTLLSHIQWRTAVSAA